MKNIQVSAFRWVPPFAQGLVRDLRVRWALEEAGRSYDERLISFEDQKTPEYREWQPFGQVPAINEDGLVLFESGAIVMHIAEASDALMPSDAATQAHVKTWMFAALNSVEPPIMMLNYMDMQPGGPAQAPQPLRANIVQWIRMRLDNLAAFLGNRQYIVGDRFTAADLLMVSVLRILRTTDLLNDLRTLSAYQARGEARPAFQKALADQMRVFEKNTP